MKFLYFFKRFFPFLIYFILKTCIKTFWYIIGIKIELKNKTIWILFFSFDLYTYIVLKHLKKQNI